jgi:hypothetical protein
MRFSRDFFFITIEWLVYLIVFIKICFSSELKIKKERSPVHCLLLQ